MLLGPTAIGKSNLAIATALRHNGEIISMDSCAIYRGLDIGSAKPTAAQREQVVHHLVDIYDPDERYSAGRFFADACQLVKEISARGKQPIIVGGTMLYANILLNGMTHIPPISSRSRAAAQELVDRDQAKAYQQLGQRDPVFAQSIHANDSQRITRAWEVLLETDRPLGDWLNEPNLLPDFKPQLCAMLPSDRAALRTRLDTRLDTMMAAGFLSEIKRLVAQYGPNIQSLRSVGYKQLLPCVLGTVDQVQALAAAKQATRRLARYQMSWIRRFNLPTETIYWS